MTVVTTDIQGFAQGAFANTLFASGIAAGNSGLQFEVVITDNPEPEGIQFQNDISFSLPNGLQFFATNLGFNCPGYAEGPFGLLPFATSACIASAAMQFDVTIEDFANPNGVEFFIGVTDFPDPEGVQFEGVITFSDPEGVEFDVTIADFANAQGVQWNQQIVDYPNPQGLQWENFVTFSDPEGVQFEAAVVHVEGVEFRVNLYNTTQLRILCDFPSRGAVSGAGTNAWGNQVATGESWRTNSQNPSADFNINNVNSDIVEQTFRSATGTITGINLDCDVESSPGSFLDTFAILNHNLTTGASLVLVGADNSSFSPIGKTINLVARADNIFHIEPDLPLTAFRYWRLQIDDTNQTDGYIEIGTILFGSSVIFTQDECMVDRIMKKPRHFVDSVRTEGFTSVKNNRSLKNRISLRFESLQFGKGNFQSLDDIFKSARTSQKCLWIPTPHPTDGAITERFAVFGKIVDLPEQEHNVKGTVGEDLDFISFGFDVDEAE